MFNISYEATLVAGQIGFSLHEESTPVVEPFAGWAMLTTQDTHLAVRNHIQANLSSLIFSIIHLNIHKGKGHHSSLSHCIANYAKIPYINYCFNEDSQQHITCCPYFSNCNSFDINLRDWDI